jgi:hypothetical protein
MRNLITAFGSFVAGVLITLLLGLGSPHTSTVIQPVSAETIFAHVEGAAPPVPDINLAHFNKGVSATGVILELDGIDCEDCIVKDGGTIRYSGGKYKFTNLQRSGRLTIDLKGAALNTAGLLQSFGLIGCPTATPPTEVNPNRIIKTAKLSLQTVSGLSSQVGK